MQRVRRETFQNPEYVIHVVGVPAPNLRDLYHALLRIPWWGAIAVIVGGYLFLNAVFALFYLATGGIANAQPGSFADAFFFSVQTMGTIGYGSMYPVTRLANFLVVAESVTGLIVTALATGLVFVRFSHSRARVAFSDKVAISPMDGVPTLAVRVGNERRGNIVEARFRLTLMRTMRTREGVTVYRSEELALQRERAPALSRSWNVMHCMVPGSPLHGITPEEFAAAEAELTLAVSGTDDVSLQPVHARTTWYARSVVFGARLADVLFDQPDGSMLLDLRRFHALEPSEPSEGFPYRATS